mmetsp:Transcript_1071/g.1767  ORF Transcript_1071/g.1767 Transcript_1071/m.1767 type:complete len:152 (+) Transcript_1071:21-476(+)
MMRMILTSVAVFLCVIQLSVSLRPAGMMASSCRIIPNSGSFGTSKRRHDATVVAATLPGDPLVTGTLSQGIMNGISLYSNIIFARIALSWFPQLPQQFPILRPIFTVTEPYLRVFRKTIPSIAGFDISVIPAVLILDILSSTTAAVGAEFP